MSIDKKQIIPDTYMIYLRLIGKLDHFLKVMFYFAFLVFLIFLVNLSTSFAQSFVETQKPVISVSEQITPIAKNITLTVAQGEATDVFFSVKYDVTKELFAKILSYPSHGRLSEIDQNEGKVTYIPEKNYTGEDSFSYIAVDGSKESNVAYIKLIVQSDKVVQKEQETDSQDKELSIPNAPPPSSSKDESYFM